MKFDEQGISIWESKLAEIFQSRNKSVIDEAICGFGDVELVKISEDGEILRPWESLLPPSRVKKVCSFLLMMALRSACLKEFFRVDKRN